jgi:hypothetical protein
MSDEQTTGIADIFFIGIRHPLTGPGFQFRNMALIDKMMWCSQIAGGMRRGEEDPEYFPGLHIF